MINPFFHSTAFRFFFSIPPAQIPSQIPIRMINTEFHRLPLRPFEFRQNLLNSSVFSDDNKPTQTKYIIKNQAVKYNFFNSPPFSWKQQSLVT